MNNLRWILLGVAVVIIVAVYLFGRVRKRDQTYSSICAVPEVPEFSATEEQKAKRIERAKENTDENGWTDGVSPVRVVSTYGVVDDADEIVVDNVQQDPIIDNNYDMSQYATESFDEGDFETMSNEPAMDDSYEESVTNGYVEEGYHVQTNNDEANINIQTDESDMAIDDVISIYVLAKQGATMNGGDVLESSYASNLQYGEMKIFHRHADSVGREILFSMASIQEPGWFDLDELDEMETTGLSFFMQANLVDNPSAVLDEMLICAHGIASKLNSTLCNSYRNVLDEAYTVKLRAKIKQLELLKDTSAH